MPAQWNIVVPPAIENESECTEKQVGYIKGLFKSIGGVPPDLDIESLGIQQASALIDQLIGIRDNGPNGPATFGSPIWKKLKRILLILGLCLVAFVVFVIIVGVMSSN